MTTERAKPAVADDGEDDEGPSEPPRLRAYTKYDHIAELSSRRVEVRQLPRLLGYALRLAWRTRPLSLTLVVVADVVQALGLATQVLVAQVAIGDVLAVAARDGSVASAMRAAIPIVLVTAFLGLLSAARPWVDRDLQKRIHVAANRRVLETAAAVDLLQFEDPAFFDRVQRVTQSSGNVAAAIRGTLALLGSTLGIVALGGALASLHVILLPVVLLAVLPTWVVGLRNARDRFTLDAEVVPLLRRSGYLNRALSGRAEAKEIRSFALARTLLGRWDSVNEEMLAADYAYFRTMQRRYLVARLVRAGALGGALLIVVVLLVEGQLDVAGATVAALTVQRVTREISTAVSSWAELFTSALFVDDYVAFVELDVRVRDEPAAQPAFERLTAHDVVFTYPGASRPALRGVDLEIGRGEIVALVGENGSGKTTLAKVLAALYAPESGSVRWDGVDVRDLDEAAVRGQVAPIFQDFARYQFTARDNITFGRVAAAADSERMVTAADAAGAAGLIGRFPSGYDTVLSREYADGQDLSVGQWQRIALARALFRDAAFVVLDEPTAALDPRAEHELFVALRTTLRDRSALLVSHRFSSVRMADRIYVMHRGRVVEGGTHDELMTLGGRYAELFTLQASAYVDPPVGPSPA